LVLQILPQKSMPAFVQVNRSEKERIRRNHRWVYQAGPLNHTGEKTTRVIMDKVLEKEHKKDFNSS